MYALFIIAFVVLAALAYRFTETIRHHHVMIHAENQTKLEQALEKYKDYDD